MAEHVARRRVLGRHEGQHRHDDQHADDVPPDADVVEQRDQLDAELVHQPVHEQHDHQDQDRHPVRRADPPGQVQERVDEERAAEVDARGDRDLAEEVEPAGEPGPGRAVRAGQLGRPVVQAARRREAGADLGHGQPDRQREQADDGPAPDDDGGAAGVHAVPVQGQAAGQDRDDRERHGEVREPGHPPHEFLCVAEFVQAALVLARRRGGGNIVGHAISLGEQSTYGWKRSIE